MKGILWGFVALMFLLVAGCGNNTPDKPIAEQDNLLPDSAQDDFLFTEEDSVLIDDVDTAEDSDNLVTDEDLLDEDLIEEEPDQDTAEIDAVEEEPDQDLAETEPVDEDLVDEDLVDVDLTDEDLVDEDTVDEDLAEEDILDVDQVDLDTAEADIIIPEDPDYFNDLVWTDIPRGLMWIRTARVRSDNGSYGLVEATTFCNNLVLPLTNNPYGWDSHNDWRLPTISELRTLVKEGCYNLTPGGVCGVTDECLTAGCWDETDCSVQPSTTCKNPEIDTLIHIPANVIGSYFISSSAASTVSQWILDLDYGKGITPAYNGAVKCVRNL